MSIVQSLSNRAVFQSLRSTTLAFTGSACTIGGLVADVLQPIAPFASYLLYFFAFAFIALLFVYWRGKEDYLGAVAFTGVATAIFALIVFFQSGEESEESGFIAAAVPGVAQLQQSLGIIDAKLDDIAADTETIRESTARLEERSERVLKTLDEIRASFAGGALISDPRSPEDHYQNARLQELGGDYSAARRSYLEYFRGDLPLLDPHLRFLDFLRVQEGRAGAAETYRTVMAGREDGVAAYVQLLLLEPPRRRMQLLAYASEHPNFAPVFYHLSEEVSQRRLGFQTLAHKRAEREYLEKFIAADESGGLLRHMIDQSLVDAWRSDAAQRLQRLTAMGASLLETPVSISWNVNNSGYTGTVSIAEPTLEVLWKLPQQSDPVSTGESGAISPQTGQAMPRMFFSLPNGQGDTSIELSYRDAAGELQGPYTFEFKGKQQSEDANQRILESTTTAWLSFRDYDGKRLLYFTHLMSYRGSIARIDYGLNREKPNKRYVFPAWTKAGMAPLDASTPMYIAVPRGTRYATVQLTYKSGEMSAIQRFDYAR